MDILKMMKSIKTVKMTEEMKQRIIDNILGVISNSEIGESLIDKDVKENTEQ